jgi:hypothetical protein
MQPVSDMLVGVWLNFCSKMQHNSLHACIHDMLFDWALGVDPVSFEAASDAAESENNFILLCGQICTEAIGLPLLWVMSVFRVPSKISDSFLLAPE